MDDDWGYPYDLEHLHISVVLWPVLFRVFSSHELQRYFIHPKLATAMFTCFIMWGKLHQWGKIQKCLVSVREKPIVRWYPYDFRTPPCFSGVNLNKDI